MTAVLLDTDILSEVLKGKDPNVHAHFTRYLAFHSEVSFTSATVMEIMAGYRKRGASLQAQRADGLFMQNNEVVPEAADYRLAAQIIGDLLKKGKGIGMVDPLIAACAIRRGYGIASGNTVHFGYIREVGYQFELVNWRNAD